MSKRLIRGALDTQLATIEQLTDEPSIYPKLIPIFNENSEGFLPSNEITSPITQTYCRTSIISNTTTEESIGYGGMDRLSFIYQIDLFYPPNIGTDGPDWMVDKIISTFPTKDYLHNGDLAVHVNSISPAATKQTTNYYMAVIRLIGESYRTRD